MTNRMLNKAVLWMTVTVLCSRWTQGAATTPDLPVSAAPECDTTGLMWECTVTSGESGTVNDDKVEVQCPDGYSIVDCKLAQVMT